MAQEAEAKGRAGVDAQSHMCTKHRLHPNDGRKLQKELQLQRNTADLCFQEITGLNAGRYLSPQEAKEDPVAVL